MFLKKERMDDYSLSRSEYSNLLVSKYTPCIYQGFESMFKDTLKLCQDNEEEEKYLMTLQNMLSRVPKWNQGIIDAEVERIKKESNCSYIGDLLTCVHVTHMKILTGVRVGQKKKKIDVNIPSIQRFTHDVYISCARKLYKNIFLFDIDVMPIQKQKHRREIENIIQECILEVIRNNMPVESILKAYLDETTENEVFDDIEELEMEGGGSELSEPVSTSLSAPVSTSLSAPVSSSLSTPLSTSMSTPLSTSLSAPVSTSLSAPLYNPVQSSASTQVATLSPTQTPTLSPIQTPTLSPTQAPTPTSYLSSMSEEISLDNSNEASFDKPLISIQKETTPQASFLGQQIPTSTTTQNTIETNDDYKINIGSGDIDIDLGIETL